MLISLYKLFFLIKYVTSKVNFTPQVVKYFWDCFGFRENQPYLAPNRFFRILIAFKSTLRLVLSEIYEIQSKKI